MRRVFIISLVTLVIDLGFGVMSIMVGMGFANPLFDESNDSVAFINQMRAMANLLDQLDWIELLVGLVSGVSTLTTGLLLRMGFGDD